MFKQSQNIHPLPCQYPWCAEYNISIFRSRKKGKKQHNTQHVCILQSVVRQSPHPTYILLTYRIHISSCVKKNKRTPARRRCNTTYSTPAMSLLPPFIKTRLFVPNLHPFYPNHTSQHFIGFVGLLLGHDNLLPRLHQHY